MSAVGPGGEGDKKDLVQAIIALGREMDANTRAVREQARDARGRFTGGGGGGGGGGGAPGGPPAPGAGGVGAGALLAGPIGAVAGFVENAAFKAGREFAVDTAMGVAGDFAKFGFGAKGVSFSDSVTASALRAGGSLPIVGDLFEQVTGPLDAAAGRTAGITTAIARAGGKVDPEMRKALFQRFNQEEIRARDENNEIEKLKKSDPEAKAAAMEGTRLEAGLDAVVNNLGTIAASLAALLANPTQAASTLAGAAASAAVSR